MLRHGLDDIPVFCDLSAFHSKQVDGGITSQTRTPDAVYVQDDKLPVRIDPQDLAAGLRMGLLDPTKIFLESLHAILDRRVVLPVMRCQKICHYA